MTSNPRPATAAAISAAAVRASRSPDTGAGLSSLGLGVLLTLLAGAKLSDLRKLIEYVEQLGVPSAPARLLALVVVAAEGGLGMLAFVSAARPAVRPFVGVGCAILGLGALLLAALHSETNCGCFGGLADATRLRRIIVALSILFFSTHLIPRARVSIDGREGNRS